MDKKFFTGFFSGALIGGILAVVFMPESGRKFAYRLRYQGQEIARKMNEKKEVAVEAVDATEDYLNSLVEREVITNTKAQELKKLISKFIKS